MTAAERLVLAGAIARQAKLIKLFAKKVRERGAKLPPDEAECLHAVLEEGRHLLAAAKRGS